MQIKYQSKGSGKVWTFSKQNKTKTWFVHLSTPWSTTSLCFINIDAAAYWKLGQSRVHLRVKSTFYFMTLSNHWTQWPNVVHWLLGERRLNGRMCPADTSRLMKRKVSVFVGWGCATKNHEPLVLNSSLHVENVGWWCVNSLLDLPILQFQFVCLNSAGLHWISLLVQKHSVHIEYHLLTFCLLN